MRTFKLFYRWNGREYESIFPARNAAWAMLLAPLQLMNGAQIYGIEVSG